MTSRYDLLDRYIDARNGGHATDVDAGHDPELAQLIETIKQIDSEGDEIDWPDSQFPARMASRLEIDLNPRSRARSVADGDQEEDNESVPASVTMADRIRDSGQRIGAGWYLRQFAGMAAAALVVALLVGGLAILYGEWGDRMQQPGATVVEPGDLPGTILYVEFDSDDQEQAISLIEADGTNQRHLATRLSPQADSPGVVWTPDGEWITYFEPDAPEQWSTGGFTMISADGGESQHHELAVVDGELRIGFYLDWSHDGNSLAFVHLDEESGQSRIAIHHLETGEFPTLEPEVPASSDSLPAWAPDQWRLAFSRIEQTGQGHIYVLHAGMSQPIPVVEDDPRATQPSWSPDGESIAYVGATDDAERGNVHVVQGDGGRSVNLTNHDRTDYLPAWSTRNQIAFMSDFADRNHDIFVVSPDGSGLRNLTEDYDWRVFQPDWSDDGRYLTFTSSNEIEDEWRINVYDIETDELYIVLESGNPLHHAQWRPDQDRFESGHEIEMGDVDINLTDAQIENIRRSVEEFLSDDQTPMLRVNDDVITMEQFIHQIEVARAIRLSQEEVPDGYQLPPEMRMFQALMEELTEETGLKNVALGALIASVAVQQWAEEGGLTATQEQIDEDVERQREMYTQIRAQVPQDQLLPQDIIMDVIGEDLYWEEYVSQTARRSITEWNVDQAVAEEAGLDQIESSLASLERDLVLAEFRAELVVEAEIEIVDGAALGDADLDLAIEYITEAYPAFVREQRDQHANLVTAEEPALPGDAELPNMDAAVSAAREYAAEEGRNLGTLRHAHLISADDYASEHGEAPTQVSPDAPIWRVAFNTAEGESVFYLNAIDGSLISRAETERGEVESD